MRAAVVIALAVLAFAPAAEAGRAACPVKVSTATRRRAAPRHVPGEVRVARLSLAVRRRQDGRTAGPCTHTFGGGRFTPALDDRRRPDAGSLRSRRSRSRVVAPRQRRLRRDGDAAREGEARSMPVRLGGELFRGGTLTITVTQPFLTVSAGPATVRKTIVVRPLLDVQLDGSRTIGAPLQVVAVLRPASAGSVRGEDRRPALDARSTRAASTPRGSSSRASRSRAGPASGASCRRTSTRRAWRYGATGPGVVALEQRLRRAALRPARHERRVRRRRPGRRARIPEGERARADGRRDARRCGRCSRTRASRGRATPATTSRSTRRGRCCSSSATARWR